MGGGRGGRGGEGGEGGREGGMTVTVEPLSNDHPHQRPSLLYDHISCDGQCFLFI